MGRYAGWIALYAGIGGGADIVLIPEIPFDLHKVAERILDRERLGARFSIMVIAEGAVPVSGTRSVLEIGTPDKAERLGGIAELVCTGIEHLTGKETRFVVLGHLQRGGSPLAYDRVLATRFGSLRRGTAAAGRVRRHDGAQITRHRGRPARARCRPHPQRAARQAT